MNSPLTNDAENGIEAIDNAIWTAFAILYYETDEPSEEQLFYIRDEWENGEDPLVIDTYLGEWDLRKPIYIIHDRRHLSEATETIFMENGQLTILSTFPRDDGWILSVRISGGLADLVEKSGVPSSNSHEETRRGEGTVVFMDYHAIMRALFPIYDNIWWMSPVVTGSTSPNNPGNIEYKF